MTFAPSRSRRAATAAVAGLFACLALAPAGQAAPSYSIFRADMLAPGVEYLVLRDANGPKRIRAVRIDPVEADDIRPVLARDRLPRSERTSDMAARTGALVAINGDYALPSGRPVHTFARDGVLAQTPLTWGRNFAIDRAESAVYMANPTVRAWAFEPETGVTHDIRRVNAGAPGPDELSRFTPQGGGDERPPHEHCHARLMPLEPPRFDGSGSVVADHSVETVKCGGKRLFPAGGSILTSTMDGYYAARLAVLNSGRQMSLGWSLGWPGVMDTIGGNPTLLEGGQIVTSNVTGSGSFFDKHPRTGVGSTPDGEIIFIVVDGRQPGYSTGIKLKPFAELFQWFGADQALNLDGGGSSTLVIRGKVVNRPSDEGGERAVSSALALLPAPEATAASEDESWADPVPDPWGRVVVDPASTGGLADLLERRGATLPPALRDAARTFRDRR